MGAELVDRAIGLCIGIWMLLIGYRVIPFPGREEKREEFLAKRGALFRKGGIVVVACSLFSIGLELLHRH